MFLNLLVLLYLLGIHSPLQTQFLLLVRPILALLMFCKSRDNCLYMEIKLRFVYASLSLFPSMSEPVSCNSFCRILKPCQPHSSLVHSKVPKFALNFHRNQLNLNLRSICCKKTKNYFVNRVYHSGRSCLTFSLSLVSQRNKTQ